MDHRISRSFAIGERLVRVVDGLFLEMDIRSLYGFLETLRYRLLDIDSDETAYSRHWNAELPIEMASDFPVFRQCVEVTRLVCAPKSLALARVHVNLHLHGDMQFPHTDLPGGVTALYY